jgi:CBS domain-containing protein
MARTSLEDAAGLHVADVIHQRFSATPASATVGEVHAWFEESTHRRIAVLVDEHGRYAGSVTAADLAGADASRPASEVARRGETIGPDAPAAEGFELASATDTLRLPVVDADGRLLGVVGVTDDRAAFCGTS